MMGARFTRMMALGSAAVALAGGALVASVGTASAATPNHPSDHHRQHCTVVRGHWERTWHPAFRDRHGKRHPGYWTRTWVPTHQVCDRRP